MSYKTGLIKLAVKYTPKTLIIWVANIVLRGIAELIDFNLDIDGRRVYAKTKLYGETDTIEVLVQDFAFIKDGASYKLIIQQAESNKPWLNNLFARIIRKAWKVPVIPKFAAYMDLVAELFAADKPQLSKSA